MRQIRTLEEAKEVTAVRLTTRRRYPKVGDLFRLSPYPGMVLWGRVAKQGEFFGVAFKASLVYIYDAVSRQKPAPVQLRPTNLIIGPTVVNNLGWIRGYWEIVSSGPLRSADVLPRHFFVRPPILGSPAVIVDETDRVVTDSAVDPKLLGHAAFSNFNYVDWVIRGILEERGAIPRDDR